MRLCLFVLAVAGLAACAPDLPGRDCTDDDDCFRGEYCAGSSCVEGARQAHAVDAEADATPDASDAGANRD
ncbi:MAG: hypothetical protein KC620_12145 [Myxococcales bacterium]|nr:hypothetical protein [Myxococcales bacterium]